MGDHPRIRGEHEANSLDGQTLAGSSPHTRGALLHRGEAVGQTGIIPAYAGSTLAAAQRWPSAWDHPRIRGEHVEPRSSHAGRTGSSPHTRGAHERSHLAEAHRRIIPAYAGSTRCAALSIRGARDHPRIRGEHRRLRHGDRAGTGSSPHTRGAQLPSASIG